MGGVPLCTNKMDLKWCKSTTSWSLKQSEIEWKPLFEHSKCTLKNHTDEKDSHGQSISTEDRGDRYTYNCLNRADENPFSETQDLKGKTWLDWVNTQCEFDIGRRCIGARPDKCREFITSKFEILKKSWLILSLHT